MKAVEVFVLISLTLALAFLVMVAYAYVIPGESVRRLAEFYLYTTYNPYHMPNYTAMSPEAVTSIVWDYRGLDTLFETAVFFLALIAALALSRGKYVEQVRGSGIGLSLIVKTVTKITAPAILVVGASIALHGHLTPGGGFQGGSVIAVIVMLFIVIYSSAFLVSKGVSTSKMIVLRSLGLTGIGLTAIVVFLVGLLLGVNAYVFQSMAKPGSPISMPSYLGGSLISGTLWFFNLFEALAVAAGFSMAFLILVLTVFEKSGEEAHGVAS